MIEVFVDGACELSPRKRSNLGFQNLKPTEIDKAWMAGFMDGEGTITITKQIRKQRPSPAFRVTISVANTNKNVLEFFKQHYGGKIYNIHERRHGKTGRKWSDAFDWYCPISSSETFLKDILPYLKLKKINAQIALEFLQHVKTLKRTPIRKHGKIVGSMHLTEEELRYRESLYQKIRSLNKKSRGFIPLGGGEKCPS